MYPSSIVTVPQQHWLVPLLPALALPTHCYIHAGQEAIAASATQATEVTHEHDPWAGQHVPSQGYSPHLHALEQTHETAPLHPGHPHQHFPAAPVASPAASQAASQAAAAFPVTMSSPFAQAGYPAAFGPWAPNPHHPPSSQPMYPDSGIPPVPVTSSRHQNPWAANTSPNPWDLSAATANPWDTSRGEEAPAAVLGGDNGGLDPGYRSLEGRPAVALLAFGFAGKVYCWQPTASPGVLLSTLSMLRISHTALLFWFMLLSLLLIRLVFVLGVLVGTSSQVTV